MADDHDLRYKKLFSHPKLVEELIVSFIDEDFVSKIDFSTLEQVNKSFVTADYLKGHDIIYDKMKNQINNITEGKDMLATSIQKTKEQWLNTGMQQGMQQGALDVSRTSVIDILELRFKMVPSFLKEKINRCDNLDELKKLHRQSVIIKSINEFKFI